jgi:hypothetical protein
MEISIIPKCLIKYLSNDYFRQNDYNILISNSGLFLFFILFGNSLISILGNIPHFCLIDKIFGIECPVCGITRGFCELSSGNLINGYNFNATSILIASFFIFQIPLRIISIIKKNYTEKINSISKYFSHFIMIIIVLNWIFKLLLNN